MIKRERTQRITLYDSWLSRIFKSNSPAKKKLYSEVPYSLMRTAGRNSSSKKQTWNLCVEGEWGEAVTDTRKDSICSMALVTEESWKHECLLLLMLKSDVDTSGLSCLWMNVLEHEDRKGLKENVLALKGQEN